MFGKGISMPVKIIHNSQDAIYFEAPVQKQIYDNLAFNSENSAVIHNLCSLEQVKLLIG
jgi:hypothetical protein